jgi:hypothetical protein
MAVPKLGANELVDPAAYNRLVARAETTDAWTQYAFVVDGSTTDPTLSSNSNKGYYLVDGKIGWFHLALVWSGGDAVGSGTYLFGLPPAWDVATHGYHNGTAWIIGAGVDRGIGTWRIAARGTNATILVYAPGTATQLGASTYAWSAATPDRVEITGWVPLA